MKVELRMTNQDQPNLKFDYKKWNLVTLKEFLEGSQQQAVETNAKK